MKTLLQKSLILMSLIMISGCASVRVTEYNSAADWIQAGPGTVIKSAYFYEGGKWVLHKGKIPIVEGARIGPPTSK